MKCDFETKSFCIFKNLSLEDWQASRGCKVVDCGLLQSWPCVLFDLFCLASQAKVLNFSKVEGTSARTCTWERLSEGELQALLGCRPHQASPLLVTNLVWQMLSKMRLCLAVCASPAPNILPGALYCKFLL